MAITKKQQRPEWIRGKLCWDENFGEVERFTRGKRLNSVCVEAMCPNRGECWRKKHVTFMVLGDICTRNCRFCGVKGGVTSPPDPEEPLRIADSVKKLGMMYVVITSVTRDDLPDRGAGHFSSTVKAIKENGRDVLVELLIPDMDSDPELLRKTAFSGAEVIGHNIEMPARLYPGIRPEADYKRSLRVLGRLSSMKKDAGICLKSSLMLGLGERPGDIRGLLEDLKGNGVDIVYMGQYLSPSSAHWPVKKYYLPEEFDLLRTEALRMGFKAVLAGPMVRSSYRAGEMYGSVIREP